MSENEIRKMLNMMCELGDEWVENLTEGELDDLITRIMTYQFKTFVPLIGK